MRYVKIVMTVVVSVILTGLLGLAGCGEHHGDRHYGDRDDSRGYYERHDNDRHDADRHEGERHEEHGDR